MHKTDESFMNQDDKEADGARKLIKLPMKPIELMELMK